MMAVAGAPWQLEFEKVEQRCGYLLTSGQWSDCTFTVGSENNEEVIQAHKLVLAMASPVFEAMFYGGLSERNNPIVSIPDVQPETFRALLQYIYTDNIDIGTCDMALDLWYGAKKYMLPHLEKQCTSFICLAVGPRNVLQAYELACLYEEKTVMDQCIQIISTKTKEVLNDSSFVDVELKTLVTVCSLDHLNVDSELDLFQAVARYAEAVQRRQGQISPPVEGGPPSKKLCLHHSSTCEEKVLSSAQSSFEMSPATELDLKAPTEVIPSKSNADKQNLIEAQVAADMLYNNDTPLDIQPALDKGILEALIPALTEGSHKCKLHAASAIDYLCEFGSPAQLRVLSESAALQPYCRLLADTWGNTCYNVLLGLTHLLQKVERNAKPDLLQKLRALDVPQLLITVRGGRNAYRCRLANDLLRTYFPDYQ